MKRSSENRFSSRSTGNQYAAALPEIKENGNALSESVSHIPIVGSSAILSQSKINLRYPTKHNPFSDDLMWITQISPMQAVSKTAKITLFPPYGTIMPQPSAQQILHEVFGYPEFRGKQEAVVNTLAGGGSLLVLMPTGGGKSLCYQIPALMREGVAIVVSPLIALMNDQVASPLHRYGELSLLFIRQPCATAWLNLPININELLQCLCIFVVKIDRCILAHALGHYLFSFSVLLKWYF